MRDLFRPVRLCRVFWALAWALLLLLPSGVSRARPVPALPPARMAAPLPPARLAPTLPVAAVPPRGAPSSAPLFPPGALLAGFPSVREIYNLSCEYAAAAAVTEYYSHIVSQATFIREVPHDPNPHGGFRGAIDALWGGVTNYGVYAEPLIPVLQRAGYQAEAFYHSPARLRAELDAGHPVVVWMTGAARPESRVHRAGPGGAFYLVPYEHAVVVYGYDSQVVYTMDVGDGKYWRYGWGKFLTTWGLFDDMALLITPGVIADP